MQQQLAHADEYSVYDGNRWIISYPELPKAINFYRRKKLLHPNLRILRNCNGYITQIPIDINLGGNEWVKTGQEIKIPYTKP